jgi:hypothetical protein
MNNISDVHKKIWKNFAAVNLLKNKLVLLFFFRYLLCWKKFTEYMNPILLADYSAINSVSSTSG